MKTQDIGVLDDVVHSSSNKRRVWLRRVVLTLIGATLVASVMGLTDQERSRNVTVDGFQYLVTYPKTVHAGTHAEISVTTEPLNVTPTMSACVSTETLEVFENYTIAPMARSISNCEQGIQWLFATKDILSQGEISISGTVSDSSAYQIEGSLVIVGSESEVTIPIHIWRIP